jgi:hypothetical protein
MALCAIAFPLGVRRGQQQPAIAVVLLWPVLLTVGALTVFAFSTRITLGDNVLLDITPKHLPLLGTFRGSGRFIWSSVYLITLFGVAVVARRAGRAAAPLLAVAFLAQLYELAPMHVRDSQMRIGIHSRPAEQVLHDPYWTQVAAQRRHITLIPPPACGKPAAPYFPFSLLAADHGLTINTGYLARYDEQRTLAYCNALATQWQSGQRNTDTLYIVSNETLDQFRVTSSVPLDCRKVEGYAACHTAVNPQSTVDSDAATGTPVKASR